MVISLSLVRTWEQTYMRPREALTWADGVGSYLVDGCRRVHENRILVAALLLLVEGAESLVHGVGLCIEDRNRKGSDRTFFPKFHFSFN